MIRVTSQIINDLALVLSSPLHARSQSKLHDEITAATVTKIVDGDTLKVKYNGQGESIKLVGIDTPENKANKKAKRMRKEAKQI